MKEPKLIEKFYFCNNKSVITRITHYCGCIIERCEKNIKFLHECEKHKGNKSKLVYVALQDER